MSDLYIYCLTSKKYNLFKYLPSNIIPLGLGDNLYPKDFLNFPLFMSNLEIRDDFIL